METTDPMRRHLQLVAALRARLGGSAVETIETHISTVLLAGAHAYKLKKPVDLGFLDFTTLEARKRFCEQEVRLNRRTAPQLYLGVLAVTGTVDAPRVGGVGAAIDWAVWMRRFAPDDLLDARARGRARRGVHRPARRGDRRVPHRRAARGRSERTRFGRHGGALDVRQHRGPA